MKKVVDTIEVAGPGFINFKLKSTFLLDELQNIITNDDFGSNDILSEKRIMVEYAHPNPFKVIHIGHMRNVFYGESLIRILEAQGAEVIRTNYQGDVGMHVAKSIWGMMEKLKEEGITFEDLSKRTLEERMAFIGKSYALGATAYEEDKAKQQDIKDLNFMVYAVAQKDEMQKHGWDAKVKYIEFVEHEKYSIEDVEKFWKEGVKWSLESDHIFYNRVNSTFVREYMESETMYFSEQNIEKAKEKGILVESEGAIVFKGEEYDLHTRVFVNSLGLPTYEGKDLGLAPMQFNDYGEIDLCIHNVAVEQKEYFKVIFKVLELLNPEDYAGRSYHTGYEFVGLKTGKMSSRKGKVVLAQDILDEAKAKISELIKDRDVDNKDDVAEEVGKAAVKYSFLNISPKTYLAFDLEASLNFEGNSGPYLQYTFARANKITTSNDEILDLDNLSENLNEQETMVLRLLTRFPEVVIEAGKALAPNIICSYLFEFAQAYNSFYKHNRILDEENEQIKNTRLVLNQAAKIVLAKGLDLLGIETVEAM